jgi:hypothetical protein
MYFRSFDMGIFNAMFGDLKDPVDDDVIEAYKFAFRNRGIPAATALTATTPGTDVMITIFFDF